MVFSNIVSIFAKKLKKMETSIDREYYFGLILDRFGHMDWIDYDVFCKTADEVIDKTISQYTKSGKFEVGDWDMFDNDFNMNASDAFDEFCSDD